MIRHKIGWKIGFYTIIAIIVVGAFISSISPFLPNDRKLTLSSVQLVSLGLLLSVLLVGVIVPLLSFIFFEQPLERLFSTVSLIKDKLKIPTPISNNGNLIEELTLSLHQISQKTEQLKEDKAQESGLVQETNRYKRMLQEKTEIIQETNKKLERMVQDLSVLYHVSQMISAKLETEELYNVLTEAISILGYKEFVLMSFDEIRELLEIKITYGFQNAEIVKQLTFKKGEGISGWVAEQKKPIYLKDTSKEPGYLHYKGEKMEEGSFLSLPILSHDKLLGVMNFFRTGIDSFSTTDIKLLLSLTNQLAVSMENARLYSQTKEMAVTDDLTNVYNRRHFHKIFEMELKRTKRFGRQLSLLMIDVDHFKEFNDTYGHIQGDQALKKVAQLFSKNVREVDTVARYGGEEFSIILTQTSLQNAIHVAEKLCQIISGQDFSNETVPVGTKLTISIGVASFPEDGDEIEKITHHADSALYLAKSLGRNQVASYKDVMRSASGLRVV